jgi:hypothetical protein
MEAISDLAASLDDLRGAPDRCHALMKTLRRRDAVLSLLRNVLGDRRLLAGIAARSYPHVNGFDKIVLVGSDDPRDYRVTLHMWRPPYPASALRFEAIHGHRFSFWSAIITGTLRSESFEESETLGQRVLGKYRYVPEVHRDVAFEDFYQRQGRVRLLRAGRDERHAGDAYYLDASAIHRIILPRQTMTCSLVLRGPRLSEHSYVYNASYPSCEIYLKNRMFSPSQLADRLSYLMGALSLADTKRARRSLVLDQIDDAHPQRLA